MFQPAISRRTSTVSTVPMPVNQIPFLYSTLLDDLKMPKSTSTIPINNITSRIGISRRLLRYFMFSSVIQPEDTALIPASAAVLNPSFIINLMRNGRKNNRKIRAFHGNWRVQRS